MEALTRQLGDRLVRQSTRRGFLGKSARLLLMVGAGVVTITSVNAQTALAADPCPCGPAAACPQEGLCPNCPNTINGCPSGCTTYWAWWCCIGGQSIQCQDCRGGQCNIAPCHECICQNSTIISC